jgi:hypothetical protein
VVDVKVDMHTDIEKFCTDLGYDVITDVVVGLASAGKPWRLYWFVKKDGKLLNLMGMSDLQSPDQMKTPKCAIYTLNNKDYTEEEMLKIIKLKAFI